MCLVCAFRGCLIGIFPASSFLNFFVRMSLLTVAFVVCLCVGAVSSLGSFVVVRFSVVELA